MPTPFIWVMAVASGLMAKETTGTALYNADENKETWLSKDIPQRKGPRPSGGDFIVPHRQHSQIPSEAFRKRIEATMQQHIDANSAFLKMAPSPHERVIPSVCLRDDIPSPYKMTDLSLREVYHVHEQDASIHLTLSPQDCVTAIKRGWAERHPLSGTAVLPAQYLFVYAPRDEQELKVVEQLVRASSGYLLNRRDIA
ncbi:hypothetical protein BOTBODRAFT_156604 [Botryobasidium botryosum FD-172 SS1]|uniref:Luciferase domain-containing protein n=1 Tax=Botryobasidium botryosum (strain FD-172 SS1) TaxID=930990 RepID=A0A067MPN4_BOTB1|nr:hypothetical protein BOTBODRAFT_156604 [Botryobasidium botryosum FD-172 SS1]